MEKDAVKNEFSEKITRLTQSRAYLDFCEEIYGYRTHLFNMMDREQIDYVFQLIPIAPNDTVLDLGCGAGSLLNLIVAQYGCAGVGIDLLDGGTTEHSRRTRHICGNIDDIGEYSISPTITLSVDSLYFSRDLDKLVRDLARMKRSRLYICYSQYLFDEAEDKSLLHNQNTRLAQALSRAGFPFRTLDFSENERRLYVNMDKVLARAYA